MTLTRPGYFCAVVWTPNGWRILAGDFPNIDRLLVYDMSGQLLASQAGVIGGALNFLRAASAPDGTICWVAQSAKMADRECYLMIGRITPDLKFSSTLTAVKAFGQSGVNVRWTDGAFTVYSLLSTTEYVTARDGVVSAPMATPEPSPQGWIDVFGGNLRWIDRNRNDPAQQLLFPTSLQGVTLGQNAYNDAGDYIGGFAPSGKRFMTIQELGQEPTIAWNGTDWAWCARLLNSRIAFGMLPPFDAAPAITQPEPPDIPEPEPEPDLMPPDHRHVVNAIHAQFPHLLRTNTYATCREFVWRAAAALAAVDPRWGFLTKTPPENHVVIKGHAVAVDAVTYQGWDGVVDIISGSTSGEPTTPSWGEEGKRPTNVWMKAFPFDEGVTEPPPIDDPEPTPQTCQLTAELVSRLEASQAAMLEALQAMTEQQAELQALIEQFMAKPTPAPQVEFPAYRLRVLGQTVTASPVK